ncbi:hypothetical protein [Streptomyces sp. NPDC048436]|uniref:hypothetical protein n=1 Tax=Streptomyces sp. NPDC048436 TaxID=3365550 RepID=UPI0037114001
MRALPVRRIAATALCTTLLLGAAGPVVAAENDTPGGSAQEAVRAPVPKATELLAQAKTLGDIGGVLTPVTELLTAALKADGGKLPAADATKLADAARKAIAGAGAAKAPAAPAVPEGQAVPEAQALPETPAVPAAPKAELPAAPLPKGPSSDIVAAPDPKADALKELQTAVDALTKAATAGDATAVGKQAPIVLTGLVNVVTATVLAGGLPAPKLAGLPALPTTPQAPGA